MKFHITIKDNETGETLRDLDTKAIIGGALNEEGAESIIIASCNNIELAKTIHAAEAGTKHVKSQKGLSFRLLLEAVADVTTSEIMDPRSKPDEKEDTEQ